MEVVPQVYQVGRLGGAEAPGANVFLLTGDKLTLVDTGFRGRTKHILGEIESLGHSAADVTNIIITHYHPDHIGSLPAIKEITHAAVFAHPADAPYINGQITQPGPRAGCIASLLSLLRPLMKTTPVAVDRLLNDGDELPILGGVQIVHTPGHTPGSICLYLKQKKLVIVGDLLANIHGLSLPSRVFTTSPELELGSIKKLTELDFDTACFGHGMPLIGNARQRVLEFASELEKSSRF